ncbi:hypothetical protein ACTFIW_006067 [Dictyostelium discoideum]
MEFRYIEELQADLYELIHEATQARVLYIGNGHQENLFSLSFQIIPKRSNGIAHILEHCVLCGSKKYPVRDPFFSMTRRSLHTYMNALTSAATQNEIFLIILTLFPDTPYGLNSGGEPKEIPSLTLEELKAFHKERYTLTPRSTSISYPVDAIDVKNPSSYYARINASPLKKALLATSLCRNTSSLIDLEIQQIPYYYLYNVDKENEKRI